jgi:hypothetical protein
MNKLIVGIISCLAVTNILAYDVQVYNNTKQVNSPGGKINVLLKIHGRPDYQKVIAPGETFNQSTIGYCVTHIAVSGVDGLVAGIFKEEATPVISCKSHKLTVDAANVIAVPNPWTGKFEPKAQDFAFRWGMIPQQ